MNSKLFSKINPTVLRFIRPEDVHGTPVKLMDEKILLDECRKQNRHAQKILFETYYRKMMPVSLRYLKNESDAMEVLNNAFLKVFSKINQYKSEGSLEAWIKRIVVNASIDFVRSNKSYRSNFIHTDEFNLYGEPEEEAETEVSILHQQISNEDIFKLVSELPQATRIVFNMYVVDEFTHKQIGLKLKISEGTSKWHLSNARKILREKIMKVISNNKADGKAAK